MFAMGLVLLCSGSLIGLTMMGLGGVFAAFGRSQRSRAHEMLQMLSTPLTPIASAPGGQLVKIEGLVRPSEQGVTVARASTRQAVYYRMKVITEPSDTPVHEAEDRRDFWLEDGSGAAARIPAQHATMVVGYLLFRSEVPPDSGFALPEGCTGYQRFSAEFRAWLTIFASPYGARVEESVIAPGERVLAMGVANRAADGTLYFAAPSGLRLLVSTHSEAELRARYVNEGSLGHGFLRISLGGFAVGAAISIGSVIVGLALVIAALYPLME